MIIILRFLIFFMSLSCSTIDFIADADYYHTKLKSSKKDWSEIEVVFARPVKPFKIYGTIYIRDYSNFDDIENDKNLKVKLYNMGFDGIWLTGKRITDVPPLVIQTQNQQGVTVSVYEAQREVSITKGYPYHYK